MANRLDQKLVIAPENKGARLIFKVKSNPLKFFHNLSLKYGSHAWLNLAGHRVFFLNDASAVEQVLKKDPAVYHKGIYNETLRPLLGEGIFMSEEALWRKQRRMAAPAFSAAKFDKYMADVNASAELMVARFDQVADCGGAIDIREEMMRFALDVVFRTMFSRQGSDLQKQIGDSLYTLLTMAEQRIWRLLNVPINLALLRKKYQNALKALNNVTSDLIKHRQHEGSSLTDLLDMLLKGHGESEVERQMLRDNILSFVLAGHETTANAIAWSFLELGRNYNAKQQLIAEVDSTGSDCLEYNQVRTMPYSLAVMREAMRLYPPVWTLSRECMIDDVITLESSERVEIPKNTTVMLCAYTIQRNERYWNEPEAFYPERFLKNYNQAAWFPFGGGGRFCLGFRLAELEAIVAFQKLFRRYELSLVPNQDVKPEPIITLKPDMPILFRVKKRLKVSMAKEDNAPVSYELQCPHMGERLSVA